VQMRAKELLCVDESALQNDTGELCEPTSVSTVFLSFQTSDTIIL
jgi:hypothetical protein